MWVQLLPGHSRLRQALGDTRRRPHRRPVVQRGLLLIKQDLLHLLQGLEVCWLGLSRPDTLWQVCMRAGPKVWREDRRLHTKEVSAQVTLCHLNNPTMWPAGEASQAQRRRSWAVCQRQCACDRHARVHLVVQGTFASSDVYLAGSKEVCI